MGKIKEKKWELKNKHILALVLTSIIFIIGVTSGWLISRSKVLYLEDLVREIHKKISNIELEFLLIDAFKENITCNFLLNEFQAILIEDDNLRHKLEIYEQSTNIDSTQILLDLKKEYTLTLLRYWVFVMKLRDMCATNFTTILYFFDSKCEDCPMQGFYLTYFKQKEKNKLMVFAIQSDVGLSIVDSLMLNFNVTAFPTLVMNEKVSYSNLREREELGNILCYHDNYLNFCNSTLSYEEVIQNATVLH